MTPARPSYAPWGDPDAYDLTPARALAGRFACAECAKNRDDADRLETELDLAQAQLAKAHALLKILGRVQQRPAAREADETPHELALIGFASAFATIKARIEIYFQGAK